jgi:hypothetical protein
MSTMRLLFRGKRNAPTGLERLARPKAAQWGTDIRRRNRKRSGAAAAVLRSIVAAICVLAT